MTTVTFTVDHGAGPVNYSNYVTEADIWRDTQNGVGRWQVILDPAGAFALFGVFTYDNPVAISIDGVLFMNGYLDDIHPHLDDLGYHTGLYKLIGRDLGMDLAQFYYRKLAMGGSVLDYRNTLSGNIIRDVILNLRATFGAGNPEINPPAAGIGAAMNFEWPDRTTIADGFKEVALLDNHDFYVNDLTTNLVYFPVGTVASGVTLIDIAGSATNNILALDVGEQLGLDVKNYIEAFAGSLDDHYTELNGTDNILTGWDSANATCTVGNNYAGAPAPAPFGPAGFETLGPTSRTSIYCERSVAPLGFDLEMSLSFGALTTGYNQGGSIDLSDQTYLRYCVVQDDTNEGDGIGANNVSPYLVDIGGFRIGYFRVAAAPSPTKQAYTADYTNDRWYEVVVPVGFSIVIGGAPGAGPDNWGYIVGPGPFNWSQVVRIGFTTLQISPNPSWFIIDGLQIPIVEVSALAQSVVTPSPGYRMRPIDRQDITAQFDLQDFVDDYLNKHVDPLETLKITSVGLSAPNLTQYAGETVEVIAPTFGIGTAPATTVTYRILALHHRVVKNSDDSEYPGFTFLTDYDLVKNQVGDPAADQELDPTRYYKSVIPEEAWKRDFRLWDKYRRTKRIRPSYARG